jgi:hypothetical protein
MKAMSTINYLLVAEDTIRGKDGSLTLVKIFNKLVVSEVPVKKPRMAVAFGFFAPEEKNSQFTVSLEIFSPSNERLVDFTALADRKNLIHLKPGSDLLEPEVATAIDLSDRIELPEFGIYTITLSYDDTQLAETKFEVAKKHEI